MNKSNQRPCMPQLIDRLITPYTNKLKSAFDVELDD